MTEKEVFLAATQGNFPTIQAEFDRLNKKNSIGQRRPP